MKEHIVALEYPESDWGTDLVKFTFDHDVNAYDLKDKLESAKEDLRADDFDTLQDYADAICSTTAVTLCGTWSYVPLIHLTDIC